MHTATTDMNRTRSAAAAGTVAGFVASKRGPVLLAVVGQLPTPIRH